MGGLGRKGNRKEESIISNNVEPLQKDHPGPVYGSSVDQHVRGYMVG